MQSREQVQFYAVFNLPPVYDHRVLDERAKCRQSPKKQGPLFPLCHQRALDICCALSMQFQNQSFGQFPPLTQPQGAVYHGDQQQQQLGVERQYFATQMNPASSAPAQKYTVFVSNLSYETAWQVSSKHVHGRDPTLRPDGKTPWSACACTHMHSAIETSQYAELVFTALHWLLR
jgi:hypothetical protein